MKMGSTKNDYFQTLRLNHHLAVDTPLECFEAGETKLFLENPYPINEAETPYPDHFSDLLKRKKSFLLEIEACRKDFKGHREKIPTALNQDGGTNYAVFPRYVVDICTSKVKDPDAYFSDDCSYNWYYTGGALDCVKLSDGCYVVSPNRDNNLRFTAPNMHWNNKILDTFVGTTSGPIYSVKCHMISSDSHLFILRQKHEISVVLGNFIENVAHGCLELKRKSDIPYCDAELNNDLSSLCTLRAGGHLEIVDVERSKVISEHRNYNSDVFTFGQVCYIDHNNLIFSNASKLMTTDRRLSKIIDLNIKSSACDNICTLLSTGNSVYVATKHRLIKYDLRKVQPFAAYSHMLESEPYLMSHINVEGTDVLCLSNENSKVLMQCNETNCTLPLLLPNINDTYEEMQRTNKIHIYRNLEERFISPTVGLNLQNSDHAITVFSLNTAGDVCQQKISRDPINSDTKAKLSTWIDGLPKITTELTLTGVTDLSDAWFTLNKSLDKNQLKGLTKKVDSTLKNEDQLDEDNQFECHLEEIWLAEELEDEAVPEVDTTHKVSAWLNLHDADIDEWLQ